MSFRTKALLLAFALVVAALIGRLVLKDRFEPAVIVAWLRSAGGSAAAIPLYLLTMGVVTSFFGPAVVMMLVAGVMWDFWQGALLVWLGANVWAHLHFLVGRWVAGDTIRRWLHARQADFLTHELDHGGVFSTIMVRQLPLPFVLVNLAAGASPMRWSRWAVGNALGLVPNCVIYTQLAAALVAGAEGAKREVVVRVLITASLVIATSLVARLIQRKLSVAASKE